LLKILVFLYKGVGLSGTGRPSIGPKGVSFKSSDFKAETSASFYFLS